MSQPQQQTLGTSLTPVLEHADVWLPMLSLLDMFQLPCPASPTKAHGNDMGGVNDRHKENGGNVTWLPWFDNLKASTQWLRISFTAEDCSVSPSVKCP